MKLVIEKVLDKSIRAQETAAVTQDRLKELRCMVLYHAQDDPTSIIDRDSDTSFVDSKKLLYNCVNKLRMGCLSRWVSSKYYRSERRMNQNTRVTGMPIGANTTPVLLSTVQDLGPPAR